MPFLWSNGGGYVDPDGTVEISNEGSYGALSWLQTQFSTGAFGLSHTFAYRPIFAGQAAMGPSRSVDVFSPDRYIQEPPVEVKVVPFPISPMTNQSVTGIGAYGYVINKDSPKLDLAIEYLSGVLEEGPQYAVAQTGYFPARTDVMIPEYKEYPSLEIIAQSAATARPWPYPAVNGYSIWEPALMLEQVFASETSVDEFVWGIEEYLDWLLGQ